MFFSIWSSEAPVVHRSYPKSPSQHQPFLAMENPQDSSINVPIKSSVSGTFPSVWWHQRDDSWWFIHPTKSLGCQPSKIGGAGFCWPIHSSGNPLDRRVIIFPSPRSPRWQPGLSHWIARFTPYILIFYPHYSPLYSHIYGLYLISYHWMTFICTLSLDWHCIPIVSQCIPQKPVWSLINNQ